MILHKRKVCLLTTDKPICNFEYEKYVQDHIKKHGAWVAWWSFPIKDEAAPYLIKKPFYIYASEGKGILQYRYTVIDYQSSKGNIGILSPWQNITEECMQGKRKKFETSNSVCKTWFKATKFKRVPLKTLKDFCPIEGLSKVNTLICRSTFGYATLKGKSNA